jgi:protein TonB
MFLVSASLHSLLLFAFQPAIITAAQPRKSAAVKMLVQSPTATPVPPLPVVPEPPPAAEPQPPDLKLPAAAAVHPQLAAPGPTLIETVPATREQPSTTAVVKPPIAHLRPRHTVKRTVSSAARPAAEEQVAESKNAESIASAAVTGPDRGETEKEGAKATTDAGMDEYMQDVLRQIERNKHYPSRARTRRIEGKSTIGFTLLRDGSIRPPQVVRSSGHDILDQSALQAVNRAAPFAPLPREQVGDKIVLKVVIVFELQ